MSRLWRAVVRQFKTFDLLPEYFFSVKAEAWNLAWGPGFIAVIFCLWWFERATPMPTLNVALFLGAALVLAGYYLWRADHLRLVPKITLRFANEPPFVQTTPAATPGSEIILSRYWRVFPDCSAPVENCTGYLLKVFKEVDGRWEPTAFDEAVPLMWANRNFAGPTTIEPKIGPYLDVFYVDSLNKEIIPCTAIRLHRAALVFREYATFRLDVHVTNSAPISLKVRMDARSAHWDRPLVELLPFDENNSN
jgi:hypothetical protein